MSKNWLYVRFVHLGLSFGINFTVLGLLGAWGGKTLDARLGTGPWLFVAGVFAGVMLAFYGLVKEILALDKIRVDQEEKEKRS